MTGIREWLERPGMLERVNSMTQYPSIPTYHVLGDRGVVTDTVSREFDPGDIVVTEKIDGTNARIVVFEEGYLVGSRKEWLGWSKDLVRSPELFIVETVESRETHRLSVPGFVRIYWGEVYGQSIGRSAKEYTSEGLRDFRVFDVASWRIDEFMEFACDHGPDEIALRRERGALAERSLFSWSDMRLICNERRLLCVPELDVTAALPESLSDAATWLQAYWSSHAKLDGNGRGQAEGVVVRSWRRPSLKAKLRFEDYRRFELETRKKGKK